MSRNTILLVCALVSTSRVAAFADPDAETIVIVDHAPDRTTARDRDRALGEAPFVTVVHPDEHPATASVADAVASTVGAQTRSLGGLGAFESVSVRGASPGHTAVLIDGVPLSRIAAVTTDLGRFALDAFGEVDLYRGAVPVELGGAGVGGALDLVTRLGRGEHGERFSASIGMGSFGARHVRFHYGDDHGSVQSSTTIGYQGARGDYTYFSDGGTPLNPADDGFALRKNNQFDQLDVASRLGATTRVLTGGVRLAWKQQGLPGSTAQPAFAASLATLDVIADAHGDAHLGAATARELGYVLVEQQALHDPMAELGLGVEDRAYLTLSGGASTTWTLPVAEHRLTAGVELRGDRFRDSDRDGARPALVGTRVGTAGTVAADLALGAAVVVTAAARLDLVRTAPTPMTEGPDAFAAQPARWDVVPSPRLTARVLVSEDLAVKGSAGWYVRLPTLVELFGNRGTIVGSPGLAAEHGPALDLGLVWAPAHALGAFDRIFVEAAGFATQAHDTIAIVSTAGFVAHALNIGDTESLGGELVASARLGKTISLTASYTRLATAQRSTDSSLDGRALPRTPTDLLYARTDAVRAVAGHAIALWLDASVQSASYLDQANLQRVPGRVLAGAGARVAIAGGVGASLTVENLADTRIVYLPLDRPTPTLSETPTALADLAGFPLPGRTFYLALDWTY